MALFPSPEDFEIMAVRAGVSITQACKRADVSPAVFQRWKNGHTSPRLDNLMAIAAVLENLIANKSG